MLHYSCNEGNTDKKSPVFPETQIKFQKLLAEKQRERYKYNGNAIQEKEYMEKHETDLTNFLDSNRVFLNWIGTINEINIHDLFEGMKFITFTITISPTESQKITFIGRFTVSEDKLSTDSFAHKLKRIPNGSTIYFDGSISTLSDNSVFYDSNPSDHISNPIYLFNLFNISRNPLKISNNLQIVLNAYQSVFALTKEWFGKRITETEMKIRSEELVLLADKIRSKLSFEEKEYCDRVQHSWRISFLTYKAK
jgi:hypothetical protein